MNRPLLLHPSKFQQTSLFTSKQSKCNLILPILETVGLSMSHHKTKLTLMVEEFQNLLLFCLVMQLLLDRNIGQLLLVISFRHRKGRRSRIPEVIGPVDKTQKVLIEIMLLLMALKGLKHFTTIVCQKVEQKGRTTYSQVADELVSEGVCAAEGGQDQVTWQIYISISHSRISEDAFTTSLTFLLPST